MRFHYDTYVGRYGNAKLRGQLLVARANLFSKCPVLPPLAVSSVPTTMSYKLPIYPCRDELPVYRRRSNYSNYFNYSSEYSL